MYNFMSNEIYSILEWLIFIQVNVHCCLNDLEAADYGEFVSIFVALVLFNVLKL